MKERKNDTKNQNDNYVCPRCGEEYPRDEDFIFLEYCWECGRAVDEDDDQICPKIE